VKLERNYALNGVGLRSGSEAITFATLVSVSKPPLGNFDKQVLSFIPKPVANRLKIVASVAAVLAFASSALAYMPPTIYVDSAAYPAWRKSVNLAVFAHTNGQLVEFSLLMEKPARNIYWRLVLETYQGTNLVARSDLGYDILGPPLTTRMGNTNLAKKTLQTFSFSLSREMITNSMIYFVQDEDHDPGLPDFQASGADAVRLLDLYSSAENDQAPVRQRAYEAVTNAINREDWDALRALARPGMMANEFIRM
jgi:hypothetical protein